MKLANVTTQLGKTPGISLSLLFKSLVFISRWIFSSAEDKEDNSEMKADLTEIISRKRCFVNLLCVV